MRWHGCSGCTNPQIFGTSPFAPADFEASKLCAPAVLRPRALQDAPAPADPNS